MTKYIVTFNDSGGNKYFNVYWGKEHLNKGLNRALNEVNADIKNEDDKVSFADVNIKVVEEQWIENFNEARAFLGGKPNNDFKVSQIIGSPNTLDLQDVTKLVQELNPSHVKSVIAFNQLLTLMDAWNLADAFEPDFEWVKQDKYFPKIAKYGSADYKDWQCNDGILNKSYDSIFSSRLAFKDKNTAIRFGNTFKKLIHTIYTNKD